MKLSNADDFSAVFNFKKKLSSPHLYFHYAPNSKNHIRLGYIVSSKIEKLSVKRNYMRRLIREILKRQIPFKASFDIVIRVHKTFDKKKFTQIENEIENLIKALPL